MDKLRIMGGQSLAGIVDISGAKNAALPELCAALLSNEPVTLTNVPRLQDVSTMLKLIRNMGVSAEQGAAASWTFEMGGPNALIRKGWKRDSLKPDDVVVIEGSLARDGSNLVNARTVTMQEGGRKMFAGSSGGDEAPAK
jgi:hypothetical protein